MTTAEPVEVVTTVLGLFALVASMYLAWASLLTARLAEKHARSEAVRALAWGRFENEAMRGVVVFLVMVAGLSQLLTPMPVSGSPLRWWFQWSWAAIAALNLVKSLRNEARINRVIRLVEQEAENR